MKHELYIFGTRYDVKFTEEPEKIDDKKYAYGKCSSQEYEITVTSKTSEGKQIPEDEKVRLTLHEIVHAVLNEGSYLQSSDDEPLVQWLARCFYDIVFTQDFFELKK